MALDAPTDWRARRAQALAAVHESAGTAAFAAFLSLLQAERELLKEQLVGDEGDTALRTQGAVRKLGALMQELNPSKPTRRSLDGAYSP